jgi:hypothetical protein
MGSEFRKISRVGSLSGGTKWYLSDDCLLAAKRVTYVVEYRRFYLRDLESIVVWPNRAWVLRPIIPAILLLVLGALLWYTVNHTAGMICGALGCGWAALELALGPTAVARIQTTGASVDLPLVKRIRSAQKVLSKINAAMQVARGGTVEQPTSPASEVQAAPPVPTSSDTAGATTPIGDAT